MNTDLGKQRDKLKKKKILPNNLFDTGLISKTYIKGPKPIMRKLICYRLYCRITHTKLVEE